MVDVTDNSKAGFRRVEVLTGTPRRRRWTEETKARIVAEALVPGTVVSEVARRWDLRPQQVFDWRRRMRRRAATMGPETAAVRRNGSGGGLAELPAFVPIVPMGGDACGGERAGAGRVLVRLAGAEVAVSPGVDAALLTVVLRAVRASKS